MEQVCILDLSSFSPPCLYRPSRLVLWLSLRLPPLPPWFPSPSALTLPVLLVAMVVIVMILPTTALENLYDEQATGEETAPSGAVVTVASSLEATAVVPSDPLLASTADKVSFAFQFTNHVSCDTILTPLLSIHKEVSDTTSTPPHPSHPYHILQCLRQESSSAAACLSVWCKVLTKAARARRVKSESEEHVMHFAFLINVQKSSLIAREGGVVAPALKS